MAFCNVSVIWSRRNRGNHGCSWSSMRWVRRKTHSQHWAAPLVHDGASQVMGPVGSVVVGPDTSVDLGNDDLGVWGAEFVDFFCEQSGRVDAVGANFDFLRAVAGDHLAGIDGFLQRRGIGGHAHQEQARGTDVIAAAAPGPAASDLS